MDLWTILVADREGAPYRVEGIYASYAVAEQMATDLEAASENRIYDPLPFATAGKDDNIYHHPFSPMDGWKTVRRETGLIEAICPHGIGHPIPESIAWMDAQSAEKRRGARLTAKMGWDIHGCDGCCSAATPPDGGKGCCSGPAA